MFTAPPDVWWPLRSTVKVGEPPLPYHYWIVWHFQFLIPHGQPT